MLDETPKRYLFIEIISQNEIFIKIHCCITIEKALTKI